MLIAHTSTTRNDIVIVHVSSGNYPSRNLGVARDACATVSENIGSVGGPDARRPSGSQISGQTEHERTDQRKLRQHLLRNGLSLTGFRVEKTIHMLASCY